MTLSEAEKQYKSGKIKILAVSAPKRLDRLPEIPTWKEQGINVIFQHWKGIMGPKRYDGGRGCLLGWCD